MQCALYVNFTLTGDDESVIALFMGLVCVVRFRVLIFCTLIL